MSNYLKPFVVLLVCILIFAGVAWFADNDLLDFIQTKFYNPSIVKSYITENTKDAEIAQDYIYELQEKFAQSLKEDAVRSSFLYNQSAEDIFERSKIFGLLTESTSGLQAVQFVDANGVRMHYSTSFRDIISQSSASASYRNYTEDTSALPYDIVSVPANGRPKFTMDEQGDRIIFSYPFNDSLDVYHGTALFSVSIRALAEKLISEGRIKVNENMSVIYAPPGILVGSPDSFKSEIQKKVSEVWSNGTKDRIIIDSEASGAKFSLISFKTDRGIFFGRLVNDDLFNISDSMKIILYFSMFFTLYLALYFALNFRANPVTIIRSRIRNLRGILFEQLNEDKSTEEKIKWLLELEQRRDEVRDELKYKLRLSAKTEKVIDEIINKSWDEIIAMIRASSGHAALALKLASLDTKELIKRAQEVKSEAAVSVEDVESIEEVEEAEAIEEAEEVEAVSSIEEVEEVETVEAVSSVEVVEGFAEEDEFVQDVEEISIAIDEELFKDRPQKSSKGLLQLANEKSSSKGLLKKASKFESKKGLLQLASEFEIFEELDAEDIMSAQAAPAGKGLLRIASEIAPSEATQSENISGTRGLLARALAEFRLSNTSMEYETKTISSRKGLLALASEIEFSSSYPAATHAIDDVAEEEAVDDQIEDIINMDIVSPFVDMFSSLDNVKIEE